MRASVLAVGLLLVGVWHGPAWAQGSIEERLQRMEQRIRYLEERVAAQDRTIVEKDKQISRLKGLEDGWFNNVSVSGAVEIEAAAGEDYDGTNSNGLETATVDVAFAAEVNDWVSADVALTMGDESVIEVDEAILTLAPPDTPLSLAFGRQGLPFGVYESNLLSDALAKEIGDTGEDAAVLGVELGGVSASGFLFKGGLDRKADDTAEVRNLGFAIGYAMESDEVSIGLNLSWINDIGESDTIEEAIADSVGDDMVPGGAASVMATFGGMTVTAEYVTALDDFKDDELAFKGSGARPSAWGVEAAYGWEMYGRGATAAFAWHGSSEAQGLELPGSRFLVGFSVEFADGLGLSLEWATDRDYGTGDGGTGKTSSKATAQLAAEF